MKRICKVALLMCIFFMPSLLKAQPPSFDNESPLYGVTDVPFDDGVFLLVGLAVVYSLLKVRVYNKAQKDKKIIFSD
ncbi:MAG: hypothetical protein M3040_17675 [Bacteroidota bacterium]|nr:hypothetical protein [Bacteroidota bacterium]